MSVTAQKPTSNGFQMDEADRHPLDDPAWVVANEEALLDAITESEEVLEAHYEPYTVDRIQIPQPDGSLQPLSIPLRAIGYTLYQKLQRRAIDRKMGEDVVNQQWLQAWVVYESTHPSVRAKLWDSPALRRKYGQGKIDPVMGVLRLPGELGGAAMVVMNLSKLFDRPSAAEASKSSD